MWFADLKPISPFFASFDLNSLVSPSGLPLNPWGETLKLPLQLSLRLVASLYCSCIWQLAQLQVGSCWIQSASLDSIAVLPVLWGWQRIAIHAFESGSSGTMGKPGKSWEHATHSFAQPEASNLKLQDLRSLVCLAVCRGRTCSCLKLRLVNTVCCSSFAQSDLAQRVTVSCADSEGTL